MVSVLKHMLVQGGTKPVEVTNHHPISDFTYDLVHEMQAIPDTT